MLSTETPFLTADSIPKEEKIQLLSSKSASRCAMIIFLIFLCIFLGLFSYMRYKEYGNDCIPIWIIVVVCIIIIFVNCFIEDGTEVKINNINRTLKLQKIKIYNCCYKKELKIIDLNQVEKIKIINSNDSIGNIGSVGNYTIIYKNGTLEDISNYFNGRIKQSVISC